MFSADVRYSPRLSAAEQQLAAIPNRLKNMRPLMTQGIAPLAASVVERTIASQGAAFGHPWAALAPSTIVERTRKGTIANGILHDTGHLFRAVFQSLTSSTALQAILGGLRLVLGASAIEDPLERMKFTWHQLGTRRMPARQVIPNPLPRSFRDDVRALVHDFIATGRLRGEGGRFIAVGGAS